MASGIPDYDELKLRIVPGADGTYVVFASGPDGSTVHGVFERPWTPEELEAFMLRIGQPRRAVRSRTSSPRMEEARRFGGELFGALIHGEVAQAYEGARRWAERADNPRGLRVTLNLSSVPELMEVPWELLYENAEFLAQSIFTPVVRSLDLKRSRPPRKVSPPLRILAMVSAPSNVAALDVGSERAKLEQALGSLRDTGMVELIWLEKATLPELDRVIGAPDEIHVLHYIGHGAYDEATASGILVLEDEHGRPHEVDGKELATVLSDEHSLRLAVLNSCEGARTSHVDPFSGVATSLVRCGIEAVVGMQFEITDAAAVVFSERLYRALSQGFAVDAALAQSRRAIAVAGNGVEFATPVLFLRGTDARLFDVDAHALPASIPAPAAPAATSPTAPAAAEARVSGPSPPPEDRDGAAPPRLEPAARPGAVAAARRAMTSAPRRLAAAAAALVLLAAGVAGLAGSGSEPERRAERDFVGQVGRILERSRPAFRNINIVALKLDRLGDAAADADAKAAKGRTSRAARAARRRAQGETQQRLDDIEEALGKVLSNRLNRAAEARALVVPTREAHHVRTLLATAFDRSIENGQALQRCIPRAPSGEIAFEGRRCVDSAAVYSERATEAKDRFRDAYSALRTSLGMSESRPAF